MRTLLVYPVPPRTHWPVGGFRSRWVPTGLMSLAGVLQRAGHQVAIHVREEHLMKLDFDWAAADATLRRTIQEFRPDLLAMTVVSPALADAQTVAAWAKEICGPQVITAVGGPHPSALPAQTLQECPAIDAAAIGEGEETILQIAQSGLRRGIPGLAIREDGQVVLPSSPATAVQDLDSLPDLPYDLLDMKFYTQASRFLVRWLDVKATNIRTSRGCTNACRFCGGHLVSGVGVRYHSLDRVIRQVEQAVHRFGVEAIHFEDDTLGGDRNRLLELCELLRRRDLAGRIRWDGCLRADQVDLELLMAMRSAGCVQVEYGFETGSDASLRRLGKGVSLEQNRRAIELTHEAGLRVFADIMVGLPGQTADDFRATVDFLRGTRPEVISAVRLHPLPGTAIFNELPADVRQSLKWEEMTYFDRPEASFNLTAMPDETFDKLWREFSRYFLRPMTIRALLRDSRADDVAGRRRLRRKWISFCVRHPLRAAGLVR
jgi:anaerobic magnesium-protoporphyrin IX monomethyl ester cyclase